MLLLIAGFGWGKPVPVDPSRLRVEPPMGRAVVAAAGPVSNILLAVIASIPLHLGLVDWRSPFLVPSSVSNWHATDFIGLFLASLIILNIILAVFNLLPLAPLDGFAVAVGLLPRDLSVVVARWEPYGMGILMLLFILSYASGGSISILHDIMAPVINTLTELIVGDEAIA